MIKMILKIYSRKIIERKKERKKERKII